MDGDVSRQIDANMNESSPAGDPSKDKDTTGSSSGGLSTGLDTSLYVDVSTVLEAVASLSLNGSSTSPYMYPSLEVHVVPEALLALPSSLETTFSMVDHFEIK